MRASIRLPGDVVSSTPGDALGAALDSVTVDSVALGDTLTSGPLVTGTDGEALALADGGGAVVGTFVRGATLAGLADGVWVMNLRTSVSVPAGALSSLPAPVPPGVTRTGSCTTTVTGVIVCAGMRPNWAPSHNAGPSPTAMMAPKSAMGPRSITPPSPTWSLPYSNLDRYVPHWREGKAKATPLSS